MIYITYKDISTPLIFLIWASLAIIGISEFLKVIRVIGFSTIFQITRLSQVKDPAHYKAALRWKRVALRIFLAWVVSVIIIFLLGIWLNKPQPPVSSGI